MSDDNNEAIVDSVQLDFSNKRLYGREEEISSLRISHQRVQDTQNPEIILLKGYSGAGKSALVETLEENVEEGFFITGKFDQLKSSQPYSAIVDAFSSLCMSLTTLDDRQSIVETLENNIGSDLSILCKVLPRLCLLLGENFESQQNQNIKMEWSFERLKVALRKLICVLAEHKHTLVLFMDDLQWADSSSLDLMEAIITDTETKGLLFVGTFRSNEVDASHPLAFRIAKIKRQKGIPLKEIPVTNLQLESIHQMIADVTNSSVEKTKPFAEVVHKKTGGNVFFAIQFLKTLKEEKMLYFSIKTYQWEWDIAQIEGDTDVSDNVVDLLAHKIERLPKHAGNVLKIAACLGSYFDLNIVSAAKDSFYQCNQEETAPTTNVQDDSCSSQALESFLGMASDEGLIVARRRKSTSMYKFSHDKIQQAAYSLLPDGVERSRMHLRIGRLLMDMLQDRPEVDWGLKLVAIDQLNRGCELIENVEERVELAQLNLDAAKRVVTQSAFFPAAEYLDCGIKLLEGVKDPWKHHYELQLGLCETHAEVSNCIGNYEECERYSQLVLVNARSFRDKRKVFVARIEAMGSQDKLTEALDAGSEALAELGHPIPRRINKLHVIGAVMGATKLTKNKSDDDILNFPTMTEESDLLVIKILMRTITFAWFASRKNETAYLCLRVFLISLQRGISKGSSFAFAVFGYVQGSMMKFDEAHRWGMLALKLCERYQAKECDCRTFVVANAMSTHLRRPLQESMENMLTAYERGMETGDVQYACLATMCYVMMYYYAGLPLGPLLKDAAGFAKQTLKYKQEMSAKSTLVYYQAALNLAGRSEDPVILRGEAMDQDEYLQDANNKRGQVHFLWMLQNQLAYLLEDMNVANARLQDMCKERDLVDGSNFWVPHLLMYLSLTAIEMIKTTRGLSSKYWRQLRKYSKILESWVKQEALNCQHKYLLVKAEQVSIDSKDPYQVKDLFDKAIMTAKRSGFNQDAALANERGGKYLLETMGSEGSEQQSPAIDYLTRAHLLYGEWGAKAKVEQMESKYGFLGSSDGDTNSESNSSLGSSHFRARPRFSTVPSNKHHKLNPMQTISDVAGSITDAAGTFFRKA